MYRDTRLPLPRSSTPLNSVHLDSACATIPLRKQSPNPHLSSHFACSITRHFYDFLDSIGHDATLFLAILVVHSTGTLFCIILLYIFSIKTPAHTTSCFYQGTLYHEWTLRCCFFHSDPDEITFAFGLPNIVFPSHPLIHSHRRHLSNLDTGIVPYMYLAFISSLSSYHRRRPPSTFPLPQSHKNQHSRRHIILQALVTHSFTSVHSLSSTSISVYAILVLTGLPSRIGPTLITPSNCASFSSLPSVLA